MRLHYTQGSPFARVVRVLVRELRLDCDEIATVGFPPAPEYFAVNPLGQVPALETDEGTLFPTRIIVDHLLGLQRPEAVHPDHSLRPPALAVRRHEGFWRDDQVLAVILGLGDALAGMKYQHWAGLLPLGENRIGYDPAERHMERSLRVLDWLEERASQGGFLPGVLSVQDIAFSCIVLWTDARGPIAWRGRPNLVSIVEACAARPSFGETPPQPWS